MAAVGDSQHLNLYAYGRNNPLRFTDPTGLDDVSAVVGAVIGGGFWNPSTDSLDDLDIDKTLEFADVAIRSGMAGAARGAQIIGGGFEVAGGIALCGTGVGCVAGAPLVAHGIDNIQAGVRGERTYTAKGVTAVTGSETAGTLVDMGIGLIGGGASGIARGGGGGGGGAGNIAGKSTKSAVDPLAKTPFRTDPYRTTQPGVAPPKALSKGAETPVSTGGGASGIRAQRAALAASNAEVSAFAGLWGAQNLSILNAMKASGVNVKALDALQVGRIAEMGLQQAKAIWTSGGRPLPPGTL